MDLNQLVPGSLVMCRHDGTYYRVKILDISGGPGKRIFKVHYTGWSSGHDESIDETAAADRFKAM